MNEIAGGPCLGEGKVRCCAVCLRVIKPKILSVDFRRGAGISDC